MNLLLRLLFDACLQCSDYLDPSSLFQGELDEAQERVALCIETLQEFK